MVTCPQRITPHGVGWSNTNQGELGGVGWVEGGGEQWIQLVQKLQAVECAQQLQVRYPHMFP